VARHKQSSTAKQGSTAKAASKKGGKQVNVAMVGLGFGAEMIPIYQAHPNANIAAICQRNEAKLHKCGDTFGIDTRYTEYEDVLADPNVDFVHINSRFPTTPGCRSRPWTPAST
jgi:hypothetical protein